MMKKLFFIALSCMSFTAFAQNFKKFKVDVGIGYAFPTTGNQGGSTNAGAAFTIEPHYRLTDDIAAGLRLEGAALGHHDNSNSSTKVSVLASYRLSGEYYLTKSGLRPFLGVGLGFFKSASVDFDSSSAGINTTIPAKAEFGFFPGVGIETGHFRLNSEYNIINSAGYIAIKLGFFLGGGKK